MILTPRGRRAESLRPLSLYPGSAGILACLGSSGAYSWPSMTCATKQARMPALPGGGHSIPFSWMLSNSQWKLLCSRVVWLPIHLPPQKKLCFWIRN